MKHRFLLAPLLAAPALSQAPLYTFVGGPRQQLGRSVDLLGDVDGDGFADVLACGLGPDSPPSTHDLLVLSGRDGGLLYGLDLGPEEVLGPAGRAGDVNGDGVPDLFFGVAKDPAGPEKGRVEVRSGLDGAPLHTFVSPSGHDRFGFAVDGAGDVDGDGFDDLIVGADFDIAGGSGAGAAYVYSGFDGSELYRILGNPQEFLGRAVAGVGDIDADGIADFAVGCPVAKAGMMPHARIYSGATGDQLHKVAGDSASGFGSALEGVGDIDGDGYGDVLIGAPSALVSGYAAGSATLVSGFDATPMLVLTGTRDAYFGSPLAAAGDIDGDGTPDFLVAAHEEGTGGTDAGAVVLYSGATGAVLFKTYGQQGSILGTSIGAGHDVDGDGVPDFVIGASERARLGRNGQVVVFSGDSELWDSTCGPANPNSTGQPAALTAQGSIHVADNDLRLTASHLPTGTFCLFLVGQTPGFSTPPGSQGNLCLSGSIGRYVDDVQSTGTTGEASLQLDLLRTPTPSGPVTIQPGETWYWQAWFRDQNPQATSNLTDALRVTWH